MSTLAKIEGVIAQLTIPDAEALQEWLEDQQQMTPEFLASIDNGKTDLVAGR